MIIAKKQRDENLKSLGKTLTTKFEGTYEILDNESVKVECLGLGIYLSYDNPKYMTVEVVNEYHTEYPVDEIQMLCKFLQLMKFELNNISLILTDKNKAA